MKTLKKGRLKEAMNALPLLSSAEYDTIPELPHLNTWELVLEEVLDTDHEVRYYYRFIKELYKRGLKDEDIEEMRLVAWETAGWFNYEMMAWEWGSLDEDDMLQGLEDRYAKRQITKKEYVKLKEKIQKYSKIK